MIRLITHKLLIEFLRQSDGPFRSLPDVSAIRGVYDEVEDLLSDDYHYWLQRASFETEEGDLDDANNFIRQARGLNPEDPYVRTQWAYTTIKTAYNSPDDPESRENVAAAFEELEEAIEQRGRADAYPFHIYGSQGLAWSNRGPLTLDERAELLQTLRRVVDDASRSIRGVVTSDSWPPISKTPISGSQLHNLWRELKDRFFQASKHHERDTAVRAFSRAATLSRRRAMETAAALPLESRWVPRCGRPLRVASDAVSGRVAPAVSPTGAASLR